MSRLDSIMSFVDALEARSDRLVDSVEQSNQLINRISVANEQAAALESSIDDIRDLMESNNARLGEFGNLYEKSFYLESNMHVNDNITNQTSFETLTREYQYLVKRLEKNDVYSGVTTNNTGPIASPPPPSRPLDRPALLTKSSLANLKLKPIRCNTKRVYKKKSKYRLSGLFNINPIAYDDEESNYTKTPTSTRHHLSTTASPTSYRHYEDGLASAESSAVDIHQLEPQDVPREVSQRDDETVASSPSEEYSSLGLRLRSNSLPETPSSTTVFGKAGVMQKSNILSEFDIEIAEEKLRFNRLKHFITYGNLKAGDHLKSMDNEFSKSPSKPVVSTINLDDHTDFDNLSVVSDISDYSPRRRDSELDDPELNDFEKYLRGSRFDLNNAFPHLYKSNSQDSALQAYTRYPPPALSSSYKFHNPAAKIQLSTSNAAVSTIEQVHFNPREESQENSHHKGDDPKKILSEVIMRNEQIIRKPAVQTPESSPTKPSRPSFSVFNFALNSPRKAHADVPTDRRGSIDHISKSLTDSFLALVNTQPTSHNSTPEKIKQLKIQAKEAKPIKIKTDYQVKRMPIRIPRNDGTHSRLIIGANKTRVIDHGESSMFRKPLISKISHNSLREALSGSLT